MNKILISINPIHVEKILKGTKLFEYRKKVARLPVTSMLIYETNPIKKVVAEAEIIEVFSDTPENLWKQTKEYSGISKEFFDDYFQNKEIAYAYRLGKIKIFDDPLALNDLGVRAAPQSFIYIN